MKPYEKIFTVDGRDITFLKTRWDELVAAYSSDQGLNDYAFRLLESRYSESGRFYHNLSHIKALLNLFEALNAKTEDPHTIRFAIWFHDAVYDTRRRDNEEASAELAGEWLSKLAVARETVERVRAMVLATKSHGGENLTEDGRLFLDLDLAILGTEQTIYQAYRRAIREEYLWVPEPIYREGRKQVLEAFSQRESLYFTDAMKARFDAQAKENIKGELESL